MPGSEWAERVVENRDLYGMIEDRKREVEEFFGPEGLEKLASVNAQRGKKKA